AGGLGSLEAVEQPLGERLPRRALERLRERVHRCGRDEDVALRRIARTRPAAGPLEALATGKAGAAPLTVDDAELALRPPFVVRGQAFHDLVGGVALAELRESVRSV